MSGVKGNREMTQMISDVATLRAATTGAVLQPGDEGRDEDYDEARSVWNGAADHRPAVVARCAGPDDVAAALAYVVSGNATIKAA